MLKEKDVKQIEAQDLTINQIIKQLEIFSQGIPYVDVVTSATVGNGIYKLTSDQEANLEAYYNKAKSKKEIVKFVPASGAATRMFKFLYEFLENFDPNETTYKKYAASNEVVQLERFFNNFNDFAFANSVRAKIRALYPQYKKSVKGARHHYLVKAMLQEDGLNFGNLPKGLIPFHKYPKYSISAFEEQLYEAAYYAAAENDVYLHFTFSEKHVNRFKDCYNNIRKRVSKKTKKNFHISYSFQKKQTNTLAVDDENKPYRDANDELVFRPSGHGALLENLNDIDADVVFIKNIDNVAAQEYVEEIAFHKRVLAGKLLWLQKHIFSFLKQLETRDISEDVIKEIHAFIWNEMNVKDLPTGISGLQELLNRPLRVCGVVQNTGAPGGGPFWVKDDGVTALQIVETSQMDLSNDHQRTILNEATHFNPVDIVCGLRDYEGNKFDLTQFSNPNTGFISRKFENGRPIKALELPGLWNGSMAKWNTVFIEVPLLTFNPVKTVNDLLRKEHRPNA